MKGYFTLAAVSWVSLIVLIWLLILGLVPFGSLQMWALVFFGVVALLCSMGARGDEIKESRAKVASQVKIIKEIDLNKSDSPEWQQKVDIDA